MKTKNKRSFEVIYEDKEIIAVTKKSGLLTIATAKDDRHTLYHYVRDYLNRKRQMVFVVHRLDRDTSGIVLFAKTPYMKEDLQDAFASADVDRYYEAIVRENVPEGKYFEVRQYLAFDENSGKVYVTHNPNEGKEAITLIKAHQRNKIGTVLDIKILTGRRNQIRIALESLGLTLIGDKKYAEDKSRRMFLNEYEIDLPDYLKVRERTFTTKPLWLSEKSE
jgi:23S rRNA pseudouridine1911/1915/1917 synthase